MISTRIMVVDDSASIRKILERLLKEYGYEVTTAATGKDAEKIARETPPDLILMDILLPDLSGAEALQAIKDIPELRQVPAIFMSGIIQKGRGATMPVINVGGSIYKAIAKPFEPDDLIHEIEQVLEQNHTPVLSHK